VDPVHLIASRRETNRFLDENFKLYLQRQLKQKLSLKVKLRHPLKRSAFKLLILLAGQYFATTNIKIAVILILLKTWL
jgi:hypothetical protein